MSAGCLAVLVVPLALIPCCAQSQASFPWLEDGYRDARTSSQDQLGDDSVRCRLGGVCVGSMAREGCSEVSSSGSATGGLAGGSAGARRQRSDRQLGCISDTAARAAAVRDAAALSWKTYRDCAFGEDEVKPLSCVGSHWLNLSLTLIDSIDTLHMVGLSEEAMEAAQ
jgi:hypothetical protein